MDERLVRNTFEGEYSSVTSNYASRGVVRFPPKAAALSVPEAGEPTTRKFILTIDKQLLTLRLNPILALFGKDRTIEFAEGKWTPFVSFELEAPPNDMPTVQRIDFTNMSESEIVASLNSLPILPETKLKR